LTKEERKRSSEKRRGEGNQISTSVIFLPPEGLKRKR